MSGNQFPRRMLPMTMLTATQRQILEDIASCKTTGWQEAPNVFGDHQMLYEAGLIDGANASADDGFGLLDMRLTMAGQQALVRTVRVKVEPMRLELKVDRPMWKRWGFWQKFVASVGAVILFGIAVWTFYIEILLK